MSTSKKSEDFIKIQGNNEFIRSGKIPVEKGLLDIPVPRAKSHRWSFFLKRELNQATLTQKYAEKYRGNAKVFYFLANVIYVFVILAFVFTFIHENSKTHSVVYASSPQGVNIKLPVYLDVDDAVEASKKGDIPETLPSNRQ